MREGSFSEAKIVPLGFEKVIGGQLLPGGPKSLWGAENKIRMCMGLHL